MALVPRTMKSGAEVLVAGVILVEGFAFVFFVADFLVFLDIPDVVLGVL